MAVTDAEWITDADLPYELHVARAEESSASHGNRLDVAVAAFERNFLTRALERSGWNVSATARTLGIPLSTLKFKMDRLDIRHPIRQSRTQEETTH